jgi:hypothetical protein
MVSTRLTGLRSQNGSRRPVEALRRPAEPFKVGRERPLKGSAVLRPRARIRGQREARPRGRRGGVPHEDRLP